MKRSLSESWREKSRWQLIVAVVMARTRGAYTDDEIRGLVESVIPFLTEQELAR